MKKGQLILLHNVKIIGGENNHTNKGKQIEKTKKTYIQIVKLE